MKVDLPASANGPSSNREKASSASKDAADAWNCVSLADNASSVGNQHKLPTAAHPSTTSSNPRLVLHAVRSACQPPNNREKLLSVSLKKYHALVWPSSMGGRRSRLFWPRT